MFDAPAIGLMGAGRNLREDAKRVDGLKRETGLRWRIHVSYVRLATPPTWGLNCVDGKGGDSPPPADRAAYRNQALVLLTAESAAIRPPSQAGITGLGPSDDATLAQRLEIKPIREGGMLEQSYQTTGA